MSTFYYGVQHEIVPHIVFQDLACLWVGVFFYSSNIQHMHSHKYWRWTICFTLHRKAFELIKIFVRLSKKKKRTQCEIWHRMSSELTYLRSNTKWDYDAFFPLQQYMHIYIWTYEHARWMWPEKMHIHNRFWDSWSTSYDWKLETQHAAVYRWRAKHKIEWWAL